MRKLVHMKFGWTSGLAFATVCGARWVGLAQEADPYRPWAGLGGAVMPGWSTV